MFLRRRASKLLGVEESKHLLIVDLIDLELDLKNVPRQSNLVDGSSFTVSLEKKARSASSAKKELRLGSLGLNPMKQATSNLPVVVPLGDRLQMVITLYKDVKRDGSFQDKSVSLKIKVHRATDNVGVEECIPVASKAFNVSEYCSTTKDSDGSVTGHEEVLALEGLPHSRLRAVITVMPIDDGPSIPSTDHDDNHSVSSNQEDSDVGFDYDDLGEVATPLKEVLSPGPDTRRKPVARRASYLADDAVTPPTPQRRRSLLMQRAKSHVSSLFEQIKEESDEELPTGGSRNRELVDEVATLLSIPCTSPAMGSPSPSRRSRARTASNAASRSRRIPSPDSSPTASPAPRRRASTEKRRLRSAPWVSTMLKLLNEELRGQRSTVESLRAEMEQLKDLHAEQLCAKRQEIQELRAALDDAPTPPMSPSIPVALCSPTAIAPDRRSGLLGDFSLPLSVIEHFHEEEEEPDVDLSDPATMRQSFLVAPRARASVAPTGNALAQLELLTEEVRRHQTELALLEQEREETQEALRDAANKIVEACLRRAELEWELEDTLAELGDRKDENAALLEEVDALKKKNIFTKHQLNQYKEKFTRMEVKFRTSFLTSSPIKVVKRTVA